MAAWPSLSGDKIGGEPYDPVIQHVTRRRPDMFYVYENWQAGLRKAVIHDGSCGHCNGGRGRAGGYDPRHADWHGPYDDLEAARQASNALRDVIENKECRCVG
jgi:hypothetical protein